MIFIPTSQRLFRLAMLGAIATPFLLVLVTMARNPGAFAKAHLLLWLSAYGDDSFDLSRAIRTLTKDIPKPRIHLDVPEDLGIYDPLRAATILRCVQEMITNAVRHSGGLLS